MSTITLPLARAMTENVGALKQFLTQATATHPDLLVNRRPLVGYLEVASLQQSAASTDDGNDGATPAVLQPVKLETVMSQLHQLYEASWSVDPFLNTIIVPSVPTGGVVATPPEGEGAAEILGGKRAVTHRAISGTDLASLPDDAGYVTHNYVALGGTFDRLHPGHKILLTRAALSALARVRCGITGPKLLVNKKNKEMLQPFDVRCGAAQAFFGMLRPDLQVDVVELEERSGGTNAIPEVDAMVVSPETLPVLGAINAERREKNMSDMAAVSITFAGGETNDQRWSSTKLREMETARRAAAAAANKDDAATTTNQ